MPNPQKSAYRQDGEDASADFAYIEPVYTQTAQQKAHLDASDQSLTLEDPEDTRLRNDQSFSAIEYLELIGISGGSNSFAGRWDGGFFNRWVSRRRSATISFCSPVLTLELLDLDSCGVAHRIASKSFLARLHELPGPGVVVGGIDPFPAAQVVTVAS